MFLKIKIIIISFSFVFVMISNNLYGANDCERAKEWLEKAKKDEKNIEQTIFYSKKAIELCPDLVEVYIQLSKSYISDSDPQKAIETCNNGLKIDPFCAELHYALGKSYYLLRNFEYAISEFKKVIDLEKNRQDSNLYSISYESLGSAYFSFKDYNASIDSLERAYKLKKKPWTLLVLSRAYARQSNYTLAIEKANICEKDFPEKDFPKNPFCIRAKGLIYSKSSNKDYLNREKAIEYAKRAKEIAGERSWVYMLLSYSYALNNDFKLAINNCESAINLIKNRKKLLPIDNQELKEYEFQLNNFKKGIVITDANDDPN